VTGNGGATVNQSHLALYGGRHRNSYRPCQVQINERSVRRCRYTIDSKKDVFVTLLLVSHSNTFICVILVSRRCIDYSLSLSVLFLFYKLVALFQFNSAFDSLIFIIKLYNVVLYSMGQSFRRALSRSFFHISRLELIASRAFQAWRQWQHWQL
jgi:hypothetical protein